MGETGDDIGECKSKFETVFAREPCGKGFAEPRVV